MNFNITNYKDLKEAKEKKLKAIKIIEQEHTVAVSIAQSKITLDLLTITGNKLDTLISQRNNEKIIKLEEDYKSKQELITKKLKGINWNKKTFLLL